MKETRSPLESGRLHVFERRFSQLEAEAITIRISNLALIIASAAAVLGSIGAVFFGAREIGKLLERFV